MNKHFVGQTTHKIADISPNEDSILTNKHVMAISDGAGGYGIFAKEWSEYLLHKLPEQPFDTFENFVKWTDSIWEEFYENQNKKLEQYDTFVINKFNNEGSAATLAVAWYFENRIEWISYGDSALFVYNARKDKMRFLSIKTLETYETNPHLINWKDIPKKNAYSSGTFHLEKDDLVIIASDALACYITMTYYAYKNEETVNRCANKQGKLGIIAKNVLEYVKNMEKSKNFYDYFLKPLLSEQNFRSHIENLYNHGMILNDDYSLCGFYYNDEERG